jgi:large subunit ribosomal protein L1
MEKKNILKALEKVLSSRKRKFTQSIDLIIVFKGIDTKKNQGKINEVIEPPHLEKESRIVVVAEGDTAREAKKSADLVIERDELKKYKADRKKAKQIGKEYDFFVVEASLMADFATSFGPVLGARGKMPLPRDVIPPHSDPTPNIRRLKKSLRVRTKNQPIIQLKVGSEAMDKDNISENIITAYNNIISKLPLGKMNVGKVILKTTMGKPEVVGSEK